MLMSLKNCEGNRIMGVQIYTKDNCIFCKKAKAWFSENDVPFEEIDCSTVSAFAAMKERIPGATTVPQIIIDGHVIGGWDVLEAHQEPILKKLRWSGPG